MIFVNKLISDWCFKVLHSFYLIISFISSLLFFSFFTTILWCSFIFSYVRACSIVATNLFKYATWVSECVCVCVCACVCVCVCVEWWGRRGGGEEEGEVCVRVTFPFLPFICFATFSLLSSITPTFSSTLLSSLFLLLYIIRRWEKKWSWRN